MNKKLMGATCLVAGTALGAGMLALPMTLAKLGLLPTLIVMVIVWFMMYYATLINLELNLRAGEGLPLGTLGRLYSGRIAQLLGSSSMLILTYSLLSAYLYGGGSIFQNFLGHLTGKTFSSGVILVLYTLGLLGLLSMTFSLVEKINRLLFIGLLAVIGVMILALLSQAHITRIPLVEEHLFHVTSWIIVLPTVFTSFGFNAVVHPLTNFCNKDPILLKRAFFWGSLIPLIVYVAWTFSVLGILHSNRPDLYQQMVTQGIEVGELIEALTRITSWNSLQILVWVLSTLAILTSALGISLGIIGIWKSEMRMNNEHARTRMDKAHIGVLVLTLFPSFLVAFFVPNAFIKALAFAGMILVSNTILLPIYLLYKSSCHHSSYFYPLLKNKSLKVISLLFGFGIVLCEIINLSK